MKRSVGLLALMCCLIPAPCIAYSGNEYRNSGDKFQYGYLGGVLEAFSFNEAMERQLLDKGQPLTALMTDCVKTRHMPYGQVKAIIDKYLTDHPDEWDEPAVILIFRAVSNACK